MLHLRRPAFLILAFAGLVGDWSGRCASPLPGNGGRDNPSKPELLQILVEDYRRYGLPFPPETAILVKRRLAGGVTNGEQSYWHQLAFAVEEENDWSYWKGCGIDLDDPYGGLHEAVPSNHAALDGTEIPSFGTWPVVVFPTEPDLALAIQCQQRGWSEVAEALLDRSERRLPADSFHAWRPRPLDSRQAVALMAWNYWCNEFSANRFSREEVIRRLHEIVAGPHGMDTPEHRMILEDMESTLIIPTAEADTVDYWIESVIDREAAGFSPEVGTLHWSNENENPALDRIREQGLEAVPVLIRHLDDFRLTRAIAYDRSNGYVWHVRVADVVAYLLNGLYEGEQEELAFDFLASEGRGKRLDPGHVMYWWSGVQASDPDEYLVRYAVFTNRFHNVEVNEVILQTLGTHRPELLVEITEKHVPDLEYAGGALSALANSRASDEDKARIFLETVKSPNWVTRHAALGYLLDAGHPQAVQLLSQELRKLPVTPSVPYWRSSATSIADLVRCTNDPEVWRLLEDTARRVDLGQRMEMIQSMGRGFAPDHPKRLPFLIGMLKDNEIRDLNAADGELFEGPCAGFMFGRLTVRNFAAFQITSFIDLWPDADASWGQAEWDHLTEQVESVLAERGLLNGHSP